jgi:hypothetical protein
MRLTYSYRFREGSAARIDLRARRKCGNGFAAEVAANARVGSVVGNIFRNNAWRCEEHGAIQFPPRKRRPQRLGYRAQ